ncbi:DUF1499 domain-containing protein [Photobacterium sp. SDRW27]|uniref:DUF1499 domain-containing protein n=1 Tax=Photobacterium obscurum TaxID=2829490 RepID=UPI0022441621|nr:DUF1499 domain-containing protein [Photobacterium obscurum]MCW8328132.1 DUF1499 domain-containing protein [Photobacterium obscurum]
MKNAFIALTSLALFGCTNGDSLPSIQPDRTGETCGDKPNCVSTIDTRADHQLARFELTLNGQQNWQAIKELALALPGASLGQQSDNYIRVECRSKFFQFVDDFEVRLQGQEAVVRSESRTGYSDFGVNRERADLFRQYLNDAGYLKH